LYREQMQAVPPGFSYEAGHPDLERAGAPTRLIAGSAARFAKARERAETAAIRTFAAAGLIRRAKPAPGPDARLVHSAEQLLRDTALPWVVDFEAVECFALYQRATFRRPWAMRRVVATLADDRCRALLPWSEAARRGLETTLGPAGMAAVGAKVTTVLPGIRALADAPRRRAGSALRVLFIGTRFFQKGAVEAVQALERVRATHDVRLDLVSFVPPEWAARLAGTAGVTVHRPGGQEVVERLYGEADVLLFPSHMDTFGWVVMESMARGVPVLAPDYHAMPELVEHERSGLLFAAEHAMYGPDGRSRFPYQLPPPGRYLDALAHPGTAYVDGIAATLARVAEEPGLHERLADGALARVRSGPLSIERRREQLARVYADALG
jgi:glycosyltransferase involved in cell wall biosynthesis